MIVIIKYGIMKEMKEKKSGSKVIDHIWVIAIAPDKESATNGNFTPEAIIELPKKGEPGHNNWRTLFDFFGEDEIPVIKAKSDYTEQQLKDRANKLYYKSEETIKYLSFRCDAQKHFLRVTFSSDALTLDNIVRIQYGGVQSSSSSVTQVAKDAASASSLASVYTATHSDIADYKMRIGNTTFMIPPLAIDVSTQSTIERSQALRVQGSIKGTTGHANTRIEISLFFNGTDHINDEDNGLRALIAQFKRTPFLPLKNKYLNNVHDVYAVTLSNMIITTVAGFPNVLQAKLVCYKFNYSAYVPGAASLEEIINWKLFNWYYKRGLIHEYDGTGRPQGPGRLTAVPDSGMTNDLQFSVIPISALQDARMKSRTKDSKLAEARFERVESDACARDRETMLKLKEIVRCLEEYRDVAIAKKITAPGEPGMIAFSGEYKKIINRDDIQGVGIEYVGHTHYDTTLLKPVLKKMAEYDNTLRNAKGYAFYVPITSRYTVEGLNPELYVRNIEGRNAAFVIIPSSVSMPNMATLKDIPRIWAISGMPYSTGKVLRNIAFYSNTPQQTTPSQQKTDINESLYEKALTLWSLPEPEKIVVLNATTAYENLVAQLQLQAMDTPTHQYLGSQDIFIKIDMRTTSDANVQSMRELFAYSMAISRDYADVLHAGYIKIKHHLSNLLGVHNVLVDQLNVRTTPEYPGVYDIEMVLLDFDTMQKKVERTGGIIGTADTSCRYMSIDSISSISANSLMRKKLGLSNDTATASDRRADIIAMGSKDAYAASARKFVTINEAFSFFELYPDLELPTWEDIANAGLARDIKWISLDESHALDDEPSYKMYCWDGNTDKTPNGGVYVDPDFYFYSFAPSSAFLKRRLKRGEAGIDGTMTMVDAQRNKADLPLYGDWKVYDEQLAEDIRKEEEARRKRTEEEAARHRRLAEERQEIEKWTPPGGTMPDNSAIQKAKFDSKSAQSIGDIDTRVRLCQKSDASSRRSAWPARPDIVDSAVRSLIEFNDAQKGIQYQSAIWVYADNQVASRDDGITMRGTSRARTYGAVLTRASMLQQLYPYTLSQYPVVGVPGAPIKGEPVQGYFSGHWQPVFGVGQIDVARVNTKEFMERNGLKKTYDIPSLVYDYKANIDCAIDILKGLESKITNAQASSVMHVLSALNRIFSFLTTKTQKPGAPAPEVDYAAIRREMFNRWPTIARSLNDTPAVDKWIAECVKDKELIDHIKVTANVQSRVANNLEVSTSNIKTIIAAIMYGENEFTLDEAVEALVTRGDSSKARVRAAWQRVDELFGYNHGTGFNYLQAWNKFKPLPLEDMEGGARSSVASQGHIEETDGDMATVNRVFFDISRTTPPTISSENVIYGSFHDYIATDKSNSMARAFPTFHLVLIDEGRQIRWWKMWDNFYGAGAVADIAVHRSRKNVADTCTLMISNKYSGIGEIDSRGADAELDEHIARRSFFEIWNPFQKPTDDHIDMRDRLEPRLIFAPGSRIHLRLGYGSNAGKLPIIFNGTIAELELGDVVSVIAQGDGIELTNKLPFGDTAACGYMGFGVEPRNLIIGMMTTRSWTKQALRTMFGGKRFSETGDIGIVHFGDVQYNGNLTYSAAEVGENIYPANFQDSQSKTGVFQDVALFNPWSWIAASDPLKDDERAVQVDLHDRTVWDVIQTCAMSMPNYVAAVLPVGFRSTIFYGMPHWNMVYDWKLEQGGIGAPNIVALRKPLQQWHAYNSVTDILDNSIKATARDMYTNVIGRYTAGPTNALGLLGGIFNAQTVTEHEAEVTAYADKDIYPQFQRTTTVDTGIRYDVGQGKGFFGFLLMDLPEFIVNVFPFVGTMRNSTLTQACAFAVAQSAVRDYLKDMYDGELVVMGDPSVKPYDSMYIWDPVTMLFGVCEVKEVVHHMSLETGFITGITPDLCVAVADPNRHKLWGWKSSAAAGTVIEFLLSGLAHWEISAAALSATGATLSTAAGVAGTTGGAVAGIGASGAAAATSGAIASGIGTVAGWLGGAGSFLATAGTALKSTPVLPWVLGAAMLMCTFKLVADTVKREVLDAAECVVCNFLSYRGRELSAGVLGHKGISIGTQTQIFQQKWLQTLLGDKLHRVSDSTDIYDQIYNINIQDANRAIEGYLAEQNANRYSSAATDAEYKAVVESDELPVPPLAVPAAARNTPPANRRAFVREVAELALRYGRTQLSRPKTYNGVTCNIHWFALLVIACHETKYGEKIGRGMPHSLLNSTRDKSKPSGTPPVEGTRWWREDERQYGNNLYNAKVNGSIRPKRPLTSAEYIFIDEKCQESVDMGHCIGYIVTPGTKEQDAKGKEYTEEQPAWYWYANYEQSVRHFIHITHNWQIWRDSKLTEGAERLDIFYHKMGPHLIDGKKAPSWAADTEYEVWLVKVSNDLCSNYRDVLEEAWKSAMQMQTVRSSMPNNFPIGLYP